eukprot:gene11128-3188_t
MGDANISKPLGKTLGNDAFQVIKEGFLLKTKRLKTITSIKQRWFVLKRHMENGQCLLEYYDGKVLRGVVDLKNSRTIPRPGTAHFEVRTPGRIYYLAAEHDNVYQAVSWVQVLQRLTPGRKPRPEPSTQTPSQLQQRQNPQRQLVYYEMGDELIPLMMNTKTNRVRKVSKRGGSLRNAFSSSSSTDHMSRRSKRYSQQLVPVREAPAPPSTQIHSCSDLNTSLVKEENEHTSEDFFIAHDLERRLADQKLESEGPRESAVSGSRSSEVTNNDSQLGFSCSQSEDVTSHDDLLLENTGDYDDGDDHDGNAELRKLQRSTLRHSWPSIEYLGKKSIAEVLGPNNRPECRQVFEDTAMGSYSQQSYGNHAIKERFCLFRLTDLEWDEQLGEGFFGRVFKATHKRTGESVVVKELKESHANARAAFVSEMSLLKSLNHRNVLRFMGIFCKDDKLHLLTEYVGGGSLDQIIQNKTGRHSDFPWRRRVEIAIDVAAGMDYLHSVKVIHRDLKSENCLIRIDGSAVVADFGLARVMEGEVLTSTATPHDTAGLRRSTMAMISSESTTMRPRAMTVVGTPYFMAPELLLGIDYNESVDVFSFGILLCELIGRIEADPDIMPRTNSFGINEVVISATGLNFILNCVAEISLWTAFCSKWGNGCPETLLKTAFRCAHIKAKKRPTFSVVHHWLNVLLLSPTLLREDETENSVSTVS